MQQTGYGCLHRNNSKTLAFGDARKVTPHALTTTCNLPWLPCAFQCARHFSILVDVVTVVTSCEAFRIKPCFAWRINESIGWFSRHWAMNSWKKMCICIMRSFKLFGSLHHSIKNIKQ